MNVDLKIALSGELPARCSDALAALAAGTRAWCLRRKGCLCVGAGAQPFRLLRRSTVTIEWAQPIQFYRALSLLPRPLAACDIREEPCFETVGMMFDTSRNAVLRPDTLRSFLRKMALMGMNLGMMYTEDTYEVPGQPYFGYQRGRYTYEELHALDDYADMLGIELCPCVQTLGHLNRALHWPRCGAFRTTMKCFWQTARRPIPFFGRFSLPPARPTAPNVSTSVWTEARRGAWALICVCTAMKSPMIFCAVI